MIDVSRTTAKRFEEPPLSWHPGWAKDHPIAIFTCPGGSTGSLHDWTVAADGAVTPSVDCRCGCGFHDHIRLLEWEPAMRPEPQPPTYWDIIEAATKSDLREMEREERKRLENYARMVVGVGPYSKVVRVRTESEAS